MAIARRDVQSNKAVITASQTPPAGLPPAPRERSQGDGCDFVCTGHRRFQQWGEVWLARHLGVKSHFTPTSASWLNQVEIWFDIFTCKSLKGASFASVDALVAHIFAYLKAYNQNPRPFARKKREVRDTQFCYIAKNFTN